MGNNSVKLFRILTSSSGGDVVLRYFLFRVLAALLFGRAKLFAKFL